MSLKPVLVIPAYNPDEQLESLLAQHELLYPEQPCIVVNDGSKPSCLNLFGRLESKGIIVIHHNINQGKGAALKTAFRYYLENFKEHPGIVTADADGQHAIHDIIKVSEVFIKNKNDLHIGVREVSRKNIPLRSRFGNTLTRALFNYLTSSNISDTQSGLRGIPNQLLKPLLQSDKSRYEFEFEMFFIAQRHHINILQTPIETIYMNDNQSSHFNPLKDSMRIYFIFFRYCAVSLSSFALDFILFCLIHLVTSNIALAVFGARAISVCYNYILNKQITFKSDKQVINTSLMYLMLTIFSAIMVYYLTLLFHAHLNLYVSKISAELLMFFFNFAIQNTVIFRKKVTVS